MLCLALAVVLLAGLPTPTPVSTPEGCSPPGEGPVGRLQLDVDRHVECVLEREASSDLPRYSEQVVVTARSPEALLQRFLKPDDVRGGPELGPGGINVLPLLQALFRRGHQGPFYLYLLTTPQGRSAVLREAPIAASGLALPGAVYEPMGQYETPREALAAQRQLEARLAARATPKAHR